MTGSIGAAIKGAMIDVIIPAYNGARVIANAIDSALAQTGVLLRVIVIDDGSTDETAAIAGSYGPRVTVVSQANRGVSGARNTGIAMSQAPYIALLDQDDVWLPRKLSRQLSLLEAHPMVGLVFTDMVLLERTGRIVEDGFLSSTPHYASLDRQPVADSAYLLPEALAEAVMRCNFISPSTVLLRRAAINDVGGFDEAFRVSDDAECWLRLLQKWRAIAIEDRLVLSLIWEGNASLNKERLVWERIKMGEKALAHPELFPAGLSSYFHKERPVSLYRLGILALQKSDIKTARRHLLESFKAKPCLTTALALGATLLGARARERLWRAKRITGLRWAIRAE